MTLVHSAGFALVCFKELSDKVINLLNVLIGIRFLQADLIIKSRSCSQVRVSLILVEYCKGFSAQKCLCRM